MKQDVNAYPLYWPEGWKRTTPGVRRVGRFDTLFTVARDDLMHELDLMRAKDIVISSNVRPRRDGLPSGDTSGITDHGIAVYFTLKDRPYVIACDTFQHVDHNLRACGLTIAAMRSIDRYGCSDLIERAFKGFTALPPAMHDRPWWDVLGVARDASTEAIKEAHRAGATRFHPDNGGDDATMAQINRAYQEAKTERGQ